MWPLCVHMGDQMAFKKDGEGKKCIPLWSVLVAWLIYGQLIALGIASGYLVELGTLVWGALRDALPSIGRMDGRQYFDDLFAKLHASLMLVSMPLLFVGLLATDVESTVEKIRRKRTEVVATLLFVSVGSLVFFTGFGNRIGHGSLLGFSLLSCFLTGSSAYCYRLAFCVVTKR